MNHKQDVTLVSVCQLNSNSILKTHVPLFGILSREYRKECAIHTSDATPDVVDQLSDFENNNDLVNVVDEQCNALPAPCIYCPFITKTELDPGGFTTFVLDCCTLLGCTTLTISLPMILQI